MDVRKQIADEIRRMFNTEAERLIAGERSAQSPEHYTDRIIAIIREALLSDQAVEAAGSAAVTFHDGEGAVRAALAAAGLTPPPFDVRDYGAVGDGVTDDTAAIQATLDAAAGLGGQGDE